MSEYRMFEFMISEEESVWGNQDVSWKEEDINSGKFKVTLP